MINFNEVKVVQPQSDQLLLKLEVTSKTEGISQQVCQSDAMFARVVKQTRWGAWQLVYGDLSEQIQAVNLCVQAVCGADVGLKDVQRLNKALLKLLTMIAFNPTGELAAQPAITTEPT